MPFHDLLKFGFRVTSLLLTASTWAVKGRMLVTEKCTVMTSHRLIATLVFTIHHGRLIHLRARAHVFLFRAACVAVAERTNALLAFDVDDRFLRIIVMLSLDVEFHLITALPRHKLRCVTRATLPNAARVEAADI